MIKLLFIICVVPALFLACTSNKETKATDNGNQSNQMSLEFATSPAPGTVVAEVRVTKAVKNDPENTWQLDLKVLKIIGYGSSTQTLTEKPESVELSAEVMNHSKKSNISTGEIVTVVLTRNRVMNAQNSKKPMWTIIEIH